MAVGNLGDTRRENATRRDQIVRVVLIARRTIDRLAGVEAEQSDNLPSADDSIHDLRGVDEQGLAFPTGSSTTALALTRWRAS